MLLEQAANRMPIILDEQFVGAIDRFHVGDGDSYIINTTEGSFVLIRDHSTGGQVSEKRGQGGGCGGYTNLDVPYSVVAPGLLSGWRTLAGMFPGGVYPIDATPESNVDSIVFRNPAGIVGGGICSSDIDCEVEVDGNPIDVGDDFIINQDDVEVLVGA